MRVPGETARYGTTLTEVDGGFVVDGSKVFCTSAGGAEWAILLVNAAGPGGARHTASPDTLLMLACDLADPSVTTDGRGGTRSACGGPSPISSASTGPSSPRRT